MRCLITPLGRWDSSGLFEKFTERARQVVVLAQEEARALRHNYIGTEHILLGLLREEEGIAARVLSEEDRIEEVRQNKELGHTSTHVRSFTSMHGSAIT